ncbi:hypothetical protein [Mucilaginibacter lacusdianchii]|uniref:hypothetical protein n=1 Tax=Mucilaginibacter lacusdianchii TaxID=2684211 RepID=UPI00131C2CC8|nr:hypothetical protein [Mucilaginibacter sp. JXJ CY 39]
MIRLLLLINIFITKPQATLHLAADLKKDKAMLAEEHGGYFGQPSKYHFEIFEKYTKLNMKSFKHSKKIIGKHVINSWKYVPAHLKIFEVLSVIKVDSLFEFRYIDSIHQAPNPKYHIRATFHYHTYIISDGKKPKLIYITELKNGLSEYKVGDEVTSPIYEDVPIGQQYPDLKEILNIIKKDKL